MARESSHTPVTRPSASYRSVVTTPFGSVVVSVRPRSGSSVVAVAWLSGLVTVVPVTSPELMAYEVVVLFPLASNAVTGRP